MNVLVFGAGAVGCYLGGRLAQQGHGVTLIMRPTGASLVGSDGLYLSEAGKRVQVHAATVTSVRQAFLEDQSYDVILMTMKAYDVSAAINELVAFSPTPPPLISFQNGIGIEEKLAIEFGAERVIAGSITVPLSMDASNSVIVGHSGRGIGLAPMQSETPIKPWVRLFSDAGIETVARRDYRALKWSKTLLNIAGNATAAILNRHPRTIFKYGPTFDLEMEMVAEMLAVMKAAKIKVVDLPGAPVTRLTLVARRLPRPLAQPILSHFIASGRGEKMPSFQMDLASGKGKSEVGYHNGAIARQGQQVGVPTPVNAALNDILTKITRRELDWQHYNGRPDQLVADVRRYKRQMRRQPQA